MKQTFHAKCPCCGERLVVDARMRRVDALEADKATKSSLLDDANDILDAEDEKAKDSFDAAFEDETDGKKKSLDDFL